MATPLAFTPYLGWVDATDPANIPAEVHLITASDLLRYENLGKDVVARVNSHDTTINNNATTLQALSNAVNSNTNGVNANTNSITTLNAAVAANTADVTTLKKLRALATKNVSYTLGTADSVIIGNGAAVTLTLPKAVDSGTGRVFTVKNMNAASLTVNVVAGGGTIDGSATRTLVTGQPLTVISDGANWLVI